MRHLRRHVPLLLLLAAIQPAAAQDANFLKPIPVIEQYLRAPDLRILGWRGSRMAEDRTQHVVLAFPDSALINVKWAAAARGGGRFNNEPRYELAAYELQKLFLDTDEYVVPPTVLRAFPLEFVRTEMPDVDQTFSEASSVVVLLQYWLNQVTNKGFWDPERARTDTVYARHIGNFNTLTYLIRHSDSNQGNYLISSALQPRVFAVDNGVAFRSLESDRGFEWRELKVEALPLRTVERLRALTLEQFQAALGVLAEFEIRDNQLVVVERGENMGENTGIRRDAGRIQFGLTAREVRDLNRRREELLRMVDRGRIKTF